MDILLLVLSIFGFLTSFVFGYMVFIVCIFLLDYVNKYRIEHGKKAFSTRTIFLLSLLSGLSFII